MWHQRLIRLHCYCSILDRRDIYVISGCTLFGAAGLKAADFHGWCSCALFFLTFSAKNSPERSVFFLRQENKLEQRWVRGLFTMIPVKYKISCHSNKHYILILSTGRLSSADYFHWPSISTLGGSKSTSDGRLSASVGGGGSIEFAEEWFSNKT